MFGKNEMPQILAGNALPLVESEREGRGREVAHQGEIWGDGENMGQTLLRGQIFLSRFGGAMVRWGEGDRQRNLTGRAVHRKDQRRPHSPINGAFLHLVPRENEP